MLKGILLMIMMLIILFPLLDKKPKVEGDDLEKIRRGNHRRHKWKGPEYDERIDGLLAECIALMHALGVPVSESVSPHVFLNGSHAHFGACYPKGSKKKYSEYDFYIEISGHILGNTEKSLRNTLIHELIHTVPGGLCHTGEWRKWAKYVSARTGYHISRCGIEDETENDLKNLRYGA